MAAFNKFNCFVGDVAHALHDMKTGNGLTLEETFARAAGVSPEEWAERVRTHKRR